MWFQWGEQKDYMNSVWNCGEFLGHVFVFVNLVGQLIPSGFIISRKFAEYNLYVLFSIVVIQVGFLNLGCLELFSRLHVFDQ